MLIDTHCHFDMMPSPLHYVNEQEGLGNVVIGMTNLPSHFEMGFPFLRSYKHIRLALGLHPQLAIEAQRELPKFARLVDSTSYVGEVGLDFSPEFKNTCDLQLFNLKYLLECIRGKKKLVSVHSRGAERELLDMLDAYKIQNVIFHWYSGPSNLIPEIVSRGYYFSINEAMTQSRKGKDIISNIPANRILTETDAPYNMKNSIRNTLIEVGMTEQNINNNFSVLLSKIFVAES